MDPHPTWNVGNIDLAALQQILPYVSAAIALWFVNMAFTGWLAARRGRDDGLWAVIAFLLGPIALAAIVIMPRRQPPDVFEGVPVAPDTYTGEWAALPAPAPAITVPQRLLAGLLAAGLGAAGAGLLAQFGALQGPEVLVIVGAGSGGIVGYVLSASLIEADRTKVIGIGVAAGVLVLSVAGLLFAVMNGLRGLMTGTVGIEAIPFAVVVAVLYPIIYALFGQGVLAVSISGAAIWAAATHLVLRRRVATP